MREIREYLKKELMLSDEEIPDFVNCFLESVAPCKSALEKQLDTPDFGELRIITHTLIGIAGNVGAAELLDSAKALNTAAKNTDPAQCRELSGKVLAVLDGYRK